MIEFSLGDFRQPDQITSPDDPDRFKGKARLAEYTGGHSGPAKPDPVSSHHPLIFFGAKAAKLTNKIIRTPDILLTRQVPGSGNGLGARLASDTERNGQ